ncbi:hypothetical protein [Burkholderia gladioli]|uniref:hypothetical protein n=1 Tax=Burkholderia gladioli TaxID=28095 RepID=UPI0016405F9A|nr:hypothetical protein [Burkholderia gladioli]
MSVHYFRPTRRLHRAEGLVGKLRHCSTRFKIAVAANDANRQAAASKDAWSIMTQLFEILRGEHDERRLDAQTMLAETGLLANDVSIDEQNSMLTARKVTRPRAIPLTLREALNKAAHYHSDKVEFRIDGRNAHYLLLGGSLHGKHWVAEILISKLCKNAAAALRSAN